ncbi:MAG: serine hydrolase domain-containing protein [Nocardioides sp.]|uniref:serine hydrolase domain-containing protein n=1 Tax=Nocardioides sp. TaxID=35761 RepID=UPI0039E3CBC5
MSAATLADPVAGLAAEHGFSGVVRVDRAGAVEYASAFGLADRALGVPITLEARFGVASIAKGLTAMVVISLIADGKLTLDTAVRSILGEDLPEIDDAVTVEHLLSHRSGIGDYLDEDEVATNDYVMPVPVHQFATTEDFLTALEGHPQKFAPGSEFSYCNGGFVVLALIAERVAGVSYHQLVTDRVCRPAGLADTDFLRNDELPGDVAKGYLHRDGLRTNVLHLPVRGSGDGGVHTTLADLHRLWQSFFAGEIVPESWVREMVRRRSTDIGEDRACYGLGIWLERESPGAYLVGSDAGVSCCTWHDPSRGLTWTVLGTSSDIAWPIVALLDSSLG